MGLGGCVRFRAAPPSTRRRHPPRPRKGRTEKREEGHRRPHPPPRLGLGRREGEEWGRGEGQGVIRVLGVVLDVRARVERLVRQLDWG